MKKSQVILADVRLDSGEVITGFIRSGDNRITIYKHCALLVTSGCANSQGYFYGNNHAQIVRYGLLGIAGGNFSVSNVKHIGTSQLPFICLKQGTWWHKFKSDKKIILLEPEEIEDNYQ